MDKEDEELISEFAEKLKRIPQVEAVVLFGSLARGDYDRRSDIDILIVVDMERPNDLLKEISRIITDLRPHREIIPSLTNLRDRDESFLKNVFREGIVLFGRLILTPDYLALRPCVLLSYDISSLNKSSQVKVSRKVHGYVSKKLVNGKKKTYRYEGLKERYDTYLVSPSTLILPESVAEVFLSELRELKAKFRTIKVYV